MTSTIPKPLLLICPKCKLLHGEVWKSCRICNVDLVDSRPYLVFNLTKKICIRILLLLLLPVFLYVSQPAERADYFQSGKLFLKGHFRKSAHGFKAAFLKNPVFGLFETAKVELEEIKVKTKEKVEKEIETAKNPVKAAALPLEPRPNEPVISVTDESVTTVETKEKEFFR